MKYFKRILGLPFFLMLNIIGMIIHLFTLTKFFILYGGEAIAYSKKESPKMIADVYSKIEDINNLNSWIETRKKELFQAKTKFEENNCEDWIEIPDYKIAELKKLQHDFIFKRNRSNVL